MTFPAPFTVTHQACSGYTENDDGNTVLTYATPAERPAYCWAPHGAETRDDTTYLETVDLHLYMPTAAVGLKDLFTIDSVTYEVVDVADWNFGFHGWEPGLHVALKKWEG